MVASAFGRLQCSTTVLSSGASNSSTKSNPELVVCVPPSASYSLERRLKLNCTASEFTGSPLWNFMPGRMFHTRVVGSTCSKPVIPSIAKRFFVGW